MNGPCQPNPTASNTEGFRILVTEDDADDAMLLERAFSKAQVNLPLQVFSGGQQLIDFLEGTPLKDKQGNFPRMLLLLDLKMPLVDGFQVLEWLHERPRFKNLLVVVFSGSDQPADVQRARALGCPYYLVKPNVHHELVQMARSLADFLRTMQTERPGTAPGEACELFLSTRH